MPIPGSEVSNLSVLAKRLEGDIRSRGLQAGDRYLTAADAGLMLGVSAATAHRAMNLLVSRQLLTRRHGRGTFIGPGVGGGKQRLRVRTVFVLMPEEQRHVSSVPLEEIVDALRKVLGPVGVQFSFIPPDGSVEYVRELISSAQRCGHFCGAIPISCSRDVYRYLAEAGGPVVVLGSLYPDQRTLASLDIDYHQSGFLLAQHLVRKGHRRMALLTTGGGRPGDSAFYDGVSEALTEADLPHNSLMMRIFPHDFDAFRAQTRELLERPDRPTGIICGSDRLVSVVASTAEDVGLEIPQSLELVFQGQSTPAIERLPYPHVQPQLSFAEVAERVAQMLKELVEGHALRQERVVVPVVLYDGHAAR